MRKKLVVGNWKMHGSLAANRDLLEGILHGVADVTAQLAVCVPYPYLAQVQSTLQGTALAWGAQNVSQHAKGAYTGEVSTAMLAEFGCRYAIVGHSERRAMFGDNDAVTAAKFVAARAQGLTPILCVGETLSEREAGVTTDVVARQLDAVADLADAAAAGQAVVAYEPVWAIGTGRTATPQQAQEMHALIRARVGVKELCILYGGSVKPDNAAELFRQADINGGLIGGASLAAADFLAIGAAAQQ